MMSKQPQLFIVVVFIGLLLCFPSVGTCKTAPSKTLSPYFFIQSEETGVEQFPLKSTHAEVNINGVIADVVIRQTYSNDGPQPINARYIFPASTRAAVHGMTMTIGENVIKAEIKERKKAQQTFDTAKKQGKSASLLKQQRPNVFSMNVANIMPGDLIAIELHYSELLEPTDSIYEFVYPTVVGPRFSDQPVATAPETDRWIKNPYLKQGVTSPTTFSINVKLAAGMELQEAVCTSHDTDIIYDDKTMARIKLKDTEKQGGNRDFILKYRLAGDKINTGLILQRGQEENFFLMMMQPPARVKPANLPAREYIFVVDISGSMNGFPLNTSKKLLTRLIGGLQAKDRFNVILFAGASKVMAQSSLPATSDNIRQAVQLIEKQRGGGGTRLYSALKKGMDLPMDENISRTILIVTDGYIGAEKQVFRLIQKNLNLTNVFAFGIGSSVNRYLIEGMAKSGQGEPFIVTKPSEADQIARQFQDYVQSPVLTNINIKYDGFDTYDVEPVSIPDLFAQRPVIVFGKWRGALNGGIQVDGISGDGDYTRSFKVADYTPRETGQTLSYLWARKRIGRLSDFNIQKGNSENQAEITSLGLTYNLLTAYTSFVGVHDVVRNPKAKAKNVTQPLPLPKNVSNLAVSGGTCSNTPEPELTVLLVLAVIIIIGMRRYRRS
ncbi:VIT domain-containing protein [Desulfococcaceae bacterium HSG9]|nr:VIT domain-containing protein [Desulfococcaceae bacterium HSG9]